MKLDLCGGSHGIAEGPWHPRGQLGARDEAHVHAVAFCPRGTELVRAQLQGFCHKCSEGGRVALNKVVGGLGREDGLRMEGGAFPLVLFLWHCDDQAIGEESQGTRDELTICGTCAFIDSIPTRSKPTMTKPTEI